VSIIKCKWQTILPGVFAHTMRSLTLLETSLTFPEARATAVSAMTSALIEPRPPVALVLIKLSNTTSSRSVIWRQGEMVTGQKVQYKTFSSIRALWSIIYRLTWPRLPQILAWMEGYICFSLIVMVMSLSRMAVTRWRLASSLCLQKRTRFRSHGVMYSRQRCLSSIPVTEQFCFKISRHAIVQ